MTAGLLLRCHSRVAGRLTGGTGERMGAGMLGRVVDTGEMSTTLVDTEVSASYRLKYSCMCV